MKIKIIASIAAVMVGSLNAATISVTNTDGAGTFALVSSSGGTLLESGSVTIGTYASDPTSVGDVSVGFTQFGSAIGFFGASAPGYFTGNTSENIPIGSTFDGAQVYVVLGNGVDMSSSTEFAVWKASGNTAGDVFTPDSPVGGPSDLEVLTGTGTLLVGTTVSQAVPTFGNQPGYQLEAVPEPSITILGLLGMLGLLRRRRTQ